MEELLKQILTDVQEIKTNQIRIENSYGTKIVALFDGYTLRGNQIEKLQKHLDERLDTFKPIYLM
jgi:hypothetical protein